MNVLMLVTRVGAAEGALLHNAKRHGHRVDVLDVRGRWLRVANQRHAPAVHSWMNLDELRFAGNQVAQVYREVLEWGGYDLVLGSGLHACGSAAHVLDSAFAPLLWRTDLDFSAAKGGKREDFRQLTVVSDRIFLEDEREFDLALSHGSRSAHLRHPATFSLEDGPQILRPANDEPTVCVLYPEELDAESIRYRVDALSTVVDAHGGTLSAMSTAALYRWRHLIAGKEFAKSARRSLGEVTHVVLLGTSRDHAALGDFLLRGGSAERLIVEDTLGMANWAQSRGDEGLVGGRNVPTRLGAMLAGQVRESSATHPAWLAKEAPQGDLMMAYRASMAVPVQRDFEDLAVSRHDADFDVFFSVGAVEDRATGARFLRTRAMAEAVDAAGPALRINSHPNVIQRRGARLGSLLMEGRSVGLFYGENSTSPMADEQIRESVMNLMDRVREAGGFVAWFVRDLHWLTSVDGAIADGEQLEAFRRNGLAELKGIAQHCELLGAPSEESAQMFNELLEAHGEQPMGFFPIPPGVSPRDCAGANRVQASTGPSQLTLVYTGGLGTFYGLDWFVSEMPSLAPEVHIDFVVRETEVKVLHDLLERHGVAHRPNLRVLTQSFDWYAPTTNIVLGIALLEGEYAARSSSFKVMSYLAKGFPVLCFSGTANGQFVESSAIGKAIDRRQGGLLWGIDQLLREGAPGIPDAQGAETWGARVQMLRSLADRRTATSARRMNTSDDRESRD